MKLKFKDYEALGSPKEMAEFLRLTMPKVECCLPDDFTERWIKEFKDEMERYLESNPIPYNPIGELPSRVDEVVFAKMKESFCMRPNKWPIE